MQKKLELPKIPYDYDAIQMTRIFSSPLLASYPVEGLVTDDAEKAYGPLNFPEVMTDRPYTCGCLVSSVDGKIAYRDNPAGPVIARSNSLDPDGATADFWVLNLFRANVDAVIAGAGTLKAEPDGYNCVMDQGLEDLRMDKGLSQAPWIVICTLDGTDMPFEDKLLIHQPSMIHSSPAAIPLIKEKMLYDYGIIGPYRDREDVMDHAHEIQEAFEDIKDDNIPVIITGEDSRPDETALLTILKLLGINRTLIESPSYCHVLMQKGLLDEFILNQSGVFVGGDAVSIGCYGEPFTSVKHPETEVLSIHMHSPSFFYFRYRLHYEQMGLS